MTWDALVLVGRIVRPHGIRGEVVVDAQTDFADERFAPGARLSTQRDGAPATLEVVGSREHQGRWLVAFVGFGTMNDAETLRGCELRIPAEALMPLGPNQYYAHDLIGCQVRTIDGLDVGTVSRVDDIETRPLLAVADAEHRTEVLVPLVEGICRQIDIDRKSIVIAPPEGLLDLSIRV